MKKGCFVTSFVLLTIIIASIIYVFKYRKNEIFNVFKPMIIHAVKSDIDTKIKKLDKSIFSDSLKYLVSKYTSNMELSKEINMSDAQFFFDNVKDVMHDGSVDSTEIRDLTVLLKKQVVK